MSKLTLPLEVGKKYVRRDGQAVMVESLRPTLGGRWPFVAVTDGPRGENEAYAGSGRASDLPHSEHRADIVADHVEPAKGHPHAALMALYAQDAAETAEPWTRWEACHSGTWRPLKGGNPGWSVDAQYRRKPKTIRIGEYDVPEPLRVAPEQGQKVWGAHVSSNSLCYSMNWVTGDNSIGLLFNGMLHASREAAETHTRALISLTKS